MDYGWSQKYKMVERDLRAMRAGEPVGIVFAPPGRKAGRSGPLYTV